MSEIQMLVGFRNLLLVYEKDFRLHDYLSVNAVVWMRFLALESASFLLNFQKSKNKQLWSALNQSNKFIWNTLNLITMIGLIKPSSILLSIFNVFFFVSFLCKSNLQTFYLINRLISFWFRFLVVGFCFTKLKTSGFLETLQMTLESNRYCMFSGFWMLVRHLFFPILAFMRSRNGTFRRSLW